MHAYTVHTQRGWRWLAEGFALFRRNPPLMMFLVVGYWMTLVLINLFPIIGQIAAYLCMPALTISVLNGCRSIDRGDGTDFTLLLSGFQENLPALLKLGAFYLLASLCILGFTVWVDGGKLLDLMLSGKRPDRNILTAPELATAAQIALLLMIPVLMAIWFAPLLAAWRAVPPTKALFFSFVACWRNWKAFLAYGLNVAFWSAIVPGFILGLALWISEPFFPTFFAGLSLVMFLVFLPSLFASFYISAEDIFGLGDRAAKS